MNYYAHAYPFLDGDAGDDAFPYFLAGLAAPDWLTVVDRQCRVRLKHAEPLTGDADRVVAAVAGGAAQHIRDDAQFHGTRPFAETTLELSRRVRDVLGHDSSFRPGFLGHLLLELLLDAHLIAGDLYRLEAYYRLLNAVDPARVESAINRMAIRPAERLAWFIGRFREARILWDYLDDAKLLWRLNQVMGRVNLAQLPDEFAGILPDARRLVDDRAGELLEGLPA